MNLKPHSSSYSAIKSRSDPTVSFSHTIQPVQQQQITLVSYSFKVCPGPNHFSTPLPSKFMLPSSFTRIITQEPPNNSPYKSDRARPLLTELISLRIKTQVSARTYKACVFSSPAHVSLPSTPAPWPLCCSSDAPSTLPSQDSAHPGASCLAPSSKHGICTNYTYIHIESVWKIHKLLTAENSV